MPPKARITGESILKAAVALVREGGAEALNARALAAALGCSTQPIFSNYESMQALLDDVAGEAYHLYQGILREEIASGRYSPYKANGMAYIRFASEERSLFKLLFTSDRAEAEKGFFEEWAPLIEIIRRKTGLTDAEAELFHLEMWGTVHGIASMIASSYLTLDRERISRILTDVYVGVRDRFVSADTEL